MNIIDTVPKHLQDFKFYNQDSSEKKLVTVALLYDKKVQGVFNEKIPIDLRGSQQKPQISVQILLKSEGSKNTEYKAESFKRALVNPKTVFNPHNLRDEFKEIMHNDERRVREIFAQYEEYENYQEKRSDQQKNSKRESLLKQENRRDRKRMACNPFTWLQAKLTSLLKSEFDILDYFPQHDLKFSNSFMKDYSVNRSGQVIAILGYNDCVYFYNMIQQQATGFRFFKRAHQQARGIKFNPIMNDILVVYGPKGLIVWNLLDLPQIFTKPFSIDKANKEKHEVLFMKDAPENGDYLDVVFSNSGRYMACIVTQQEQNNLSYSKTSLLKQSEIKMKNQEKLQQKKPARFTKLEIYDFYRQEKYDKPINLRISSEGMPAFVQFSPMDNYLLVSEIPRDGVNTVKLYEFESERCDSWKLQYEGPFQMVKNAVWSQNEAFVLLHVSYTNHLHLMKLNYVRDTLEQNQLSFMNPLINYLHTKILPQSLSAIEPLFDKKEVLYNLNLHDKNYKIINLQAFACSQRMLVTYELQERDVKQKFEERKSMRISGRESLVESDKDNYQRQNKNGSFGMNQASIMQKEPRILAIFKLEYDIQTPYVSIQMLAKLDLAVNCIPKNIKVSPNAVVQKNGEVGSQNVINRVNEVPNGAQKGKSGVNSCQSGVQEYQITYIDSKRDTVNVISVEV
eukprot:403340769